MRNKFLTLFTAAAMLLAQTPAWSEGDFKTLDQYKAYGSSVVVTLSGKTQYHAFKISNPPRLVIEFTNTEFNAPYRDVTVNGPVITRIRGGQYQNLPVKLARIVVEMTHMTNYELKGEGNEVRLLLNGSAGATESLTAEKASESIPPAETAVTTPAVPAAEKPAESSAPVEIAVPAPQTPVAEPPAAVSAKPEADAEEKAEEPEPLFKESPAPAAKEPSISEPVASTPAAAPEETVVSLPEPARESADEPAKAAEPEAVSPAPVTPPAAPKIYTPVAPVTAPQEKKQEPAVKAPAPAAAVSSSVPSPAKLASLKTTLPRKPVTFDFEEADIRDVFRILSLKSGINIIFGSDITGTLTLRLENVPFDKAFQTILSLKNFISQDEGNNILRIMTPAKVAEERAQAINYSKVFPLNYAKAEEIKSNLDSIRNAEGRRGNIAVDERTNSLIITDTVEGLRSMERMIIDLDKKPEQVVIEAKIVEITLNKSTELGIRWEYAGTLKTDPAVYAGLTKEDSDDENFTYGPDGGPMVIQAVEGGTGVNLPAVTNAAGEISSIAFGLVANGNKLTGLLSALAEKGHTKILSSPKVSTINNKEAKILLGEKVPYTSQTVNNNGTTQTTNFVDVGIKLTVTPTINADKKISLQVHPEVSVVNALTAAGPRIATREAITTVIVNNNETAVIGGLITDEDKNMASSVPLMGELPIIGHLFKHTGKSKNRTELLVFITPQIINN